MIIHTEDIAQSGLTAADLQREAEHTILATYRGRPALKSSKEVCYRTNGP
jgi:hypothetical protein